MLTTYIVRGNEIAFATEFLDVGGLPIEPTTVVLQISYLDDEGARQLETIDMEVASDGSFEAVWDSSVASKGRVHWSVQANDPSAADDGSFDLTANLANVEQSSS